MTLGRLIISATLGATLTTASLASGSTTATVAGITFEYEDEITDLIMSNKAEIVKADPTACDARHSGLALLAPPRQRTNPVNGDIEVLCAFAGTKGIKTNKFAAAFVFCPANYVVKNVGYSILSGGPAGDDTLIQRTTRVVAAIPIVLSDGMSQAQVAIMKTEDNGIAGVTVFARCEPK